jgi:hypothetical protein
VALAARAALFEISGVDPGGDAVNQAAWQARFLAE